MVEKALGAGQHRVIVDNDNRAGIFLPQLLAIYGAGAGDNPVGGGTGLQLLVITSAALGRDRQLPVLLEAALISQVGDVFPGGAVPLAVALIARSAAVFIQGAALALTPGVQFGPAVTVHQRIPCVAGRTL